MTLRAVTSADAGVMAEAHRRSFAVPWSAAELENLLSGPGVFGVLVETSSDPAGFVLARMVAGEAEILTLCVDPGARGRGVGAALIAAAMGLAARSGAEAMFLEVAEDNAPALAAYARAGFVDVGRRPNYYARSGGEAVDALILRTELNSRQA